MDDSESSRALAGRRAAAFVWGTWTLMSVALVLYVLRFSSDMPSWDEDEYVPIVTGSARATLSWFFTPHVDHLMPLPKAAYLALFAATHDFRSGCVFTAVALAAASALALAAARRVRGRWTWTDATIPLATLHWGQAGNLLLGFQLHVALHIVFTAGAFFAMLASGEPPSRRRAVALTACLVGMQLCGGHGAVVAPVLAVWLFVAAARADRPPGAASPALCRALAAIPIVLTIVFSLVHRTAFTARPSFVQFVETTLQALGMSAGPIGGYGWRGTMLGEGRPPIASIAVTAAALATCAVLLRALTRDRESRPAASGLLLHGTAIVALAAAIGFGRGAMEESAGVQNRYVTAFVPLVWVAYLAWDRFAAGTPRAFVTASLLCGFVLLAVFDGYAGLIHGRARRDQFDDCALALRSGESFESVAARFTPTIHPDRAYLQGQFAALQRARLGPFREAGAK